MSKERQWPRAAVFDCDGLLLDSAHCWERAYHDLARSRGRSLSAVDLTALNGASVAMAAQWLSQSLETTIDPRELRDALRTSFAVDPPRPLAGAEALVDALAFHMPLAVATNGPRDLVVEALESAGMRDRFAEVVSAEQTKAYKPAPDVYLEACRRLSVGPSDAIAFEDSALGAAAARAAGLLVVVVPSDPGARIPADLTVGRLSDPRLREYLGLNLTAGRDPRHRRAHDQHV